MCKIYAYVDLARDGSPTVGFLDSDFFDEDILDDDPTLQYRRTLRLRISFHAFMKKVGNYISNHYEYDAEDSDGGDWRWYFNTSENARTIMIETIKNCY